MAACNDLTLDLCTRYPHSWVAWCSVKYEVCLTFLHMNDSGNWTTNLSFLSPTPCPLDYVLHNYMLLFLQILTLKVLNFWKFTSYCSGGSSASSYLTDPTSPIPSHCASIVVTSTLRVDLSGAGLHAYETSDGTRISRIYCIIIVIIKLYCFSTLALFSQIKTNGFLLLANK